jgi:hypothetical protein
MRTNTSTELLKVGFIGGGIDSAIGRAHFAALNIDRKYSLDAGLFSIDRDANYESGKFYGVAVERVYESVSQFLSAERENLDAPIVKMRTCSLKEQQRKRDFSLLPSLTPAIQWFVKSRK